MFNTEPWHQPSRPADAHRIHQWQDPIATWTDYETQAAAIAVLTCVFPDGRGTLHRPISCRDLAQISGLSRSTAHLRRGDLEDHGLLVRSRPQPRAVVDTATHYDLGPAPATPAVEPGRPGIRPAVVLHPVWSGPGLSQDARAVWSILDDHGRTRNGLSDSCGLNREYTGELLKRLRRVQLARREGLGIAARWYRTEVSLDQAAHWAGADELVTRRRELYAAEQHAQHDPAHLARVRRVERAQDHERRAQPVQLELSW